MPPDDSSPAIKAAAEEGLSRSELWTQLGHALQNRSAEDQVLWTIFSVFWAANAVLLVALFSTGRFPETPLVGIIISAIGFLLSTAWHLTQMRALGHPERFETLSERVERRLCVPAALGVSAKINEQDYRAHLRRPSARKVMRRCSIGAIAGWGLGLAVFIFAALSSS